MNSYKGVVFATPFSCAETRISILQIFDRQFKFRCINILFQFKLPIKNSQYTNSRFSLMTIVESSV